MLAYILLYYIGCAINAPSWYWVVLVAALFLTAVNFGKKIADITRK